MQMPLNQRIKQEGATANAVQKIPFLLFRNIFCRYYTRNFLNELKRVHTFCLCLGLRGSPELASLMHCIFTFVYSKVQYEYIYVLSGEGQIFTWQLLSVP